MTLETVLRPYALPAATVWDRYRGPSDLVRRLLGAFPSAGRYLEIHPPAFVTYNAWVPAFLDIPACDFGLGLSPRLRSLVAHLASRSYGCSYSAAHAAVVGTLWQGPGGTLDANARSLDDACSVFDARERAALDVAAALSAVPDTLTRAHLDALAGHFTAAEAAALVDVACGMGLLDRFMDTLGPKLEWPVLQRVEAALSPSGWRLDHHAPDSDEDPFESELGPIPSGWSGLPSLLRDMARAVCWESSALRGTPSGHRAVARVLDTVLPAAPPWVTGRPRAAMRRVLTHALVDRFARPPGPIPPTQRFLLGAVTAQGLDNRALAQTFVGWAHHAGAHPVDIEAVLSGRAAARDPLFALASLPRPPGDALVHALAESRSPEALIDGLLVIALATSFHRFARVHEIAG
ncbi:MAG: hypothetical protein AAF602_17715 [Myxococcota bacterium]